MYAIIHSIREFFFYSAQQQKLYSLSVSANNTYKTLVYDDDMPHAIDRKKVLKKRTRNKALLRRGKKCFFFFI